MSDILKTSYPHPNGKKKKGEENPLGVGNSAGLGHPRGKEKKLDLKPLQQIDVHFFGAEASQLGHKACYFLVRPCGNYLIYGLDRLPISIDFVKSKGGIYKQFFTSLHHVTGQGRQFFTTFGAPAVLPPGSSSENFDPDIKFEVYGEDYVERDLHYYPVGYGHWIYLRHADRGILFPDETVFIDRGKWKLQTHASEEQLDTLQRLEVELVLPRLFYGESPYQPLSPEMYFRKIDDIREQSHEID